MSEDRAPGVPPASDPVAPGSPAARRTGRHVPFAVLAIAAAVVVALVAALPLLGSPAASPAPSAGVAVAATPAAPTDVPDIGGTGGPTASPNPSAAASPASTGAWAALDLPSKPRIAELTGDRYIAAGLDPASGFTLHSLDGSPAADLAPRLSVDPPVELAWAAGPDPTTAVVRPARSLELGRQYRFTLAAPDGTVGDGWAFRVAGPPRVIGTIPADQVTQVPADTGIEFTFDQAGVVDPTPWFSIEPKVAGRFELHDRTWVFVPDALAPSTVYTATLRSGLPLAGSALAMQAPVVVQFETAGPERVGPPYHLTLALDVVETPPGDAPAIGVDVWWSGDEGKLPATVPVTLHRVADAEEAASIAATLAARPMWTDAMRDAVATTGLPVVARVKARLLDDGRESIARWLQFPGPLDPGWYLADVSEAVAPGQQALVQVTPVATYVVGSGDRTVVWVNRLGRGAIAGASVGVAGGPLLGRTDADGLLVARTPAAGATTGEGEAGARVLVVRAPGVGSAVVPMGVSWNGPYTFRPWRGGAAGQEVAWMSSLATDRSTYRSTDSVAVWGAIRDRVTGDPPAKVRLEIRTQASDPTAWESDPAPLVVAQADATPTASGVFTATIPFAALPLGAYSIALVVDGVTVRDRWLGVAVIRKPAYRLEIDADHRAVLAGDPVTATVTAVAYDGTALPGIPIRFDTRSTDPKADWGEDAALPTVTTGTDGRASHTFEPAAEGPIVAASMSAELGEIGTEYLSIVAFPASVHVAIEKAARVGDAIEVTGSVRSVDLAAVEASLRGPGDWQDHVGPPTAGVGVSVEATPRIWVATRAGTTYDFILKRAVPRYTYAEKDLAVVRAAATSGADGSFRVRLPLPAAARGTDAWVSIRALARDASGRTATAESSAGTYVFDAPALGRVAWLDPGPADAPVLNPAQCSRTWVEYPVGGTIRLLLRDADGPLPSGSGQRFLFVAARTGIRDVAVRTSPAYVRAFDGGALPSLEVSAVGFDGSRYRVAQWSALAEVDLETQRIGVAVTTDRSAGAVRRPGETATVTVRTTDRDGLPVAADVVVRAVDQKLYDMGLAEDDDPITTLWAPMDSGLTTTYTSHRLPLQDPSPGCGSTTGGGGGPGGDLRDDFRDRAVFSRVRTGPDGTATVAIDLPDDLTSWHVAATAVTSDLRGGVGTTAVLVGLPFYVEPVAPDTVLATDAPRVVLRAFGSALATGDPVRYTVTAPTLLVAPASVTAPAFGTASVALSDSRGPLPVGTHRVVIEGVARTGSGEVRDAKAITLEVVGTRAGVRRSETVTIGNGTRVPGAAGSLTTCTLADAGRGSVLPILDGIAWDDGPRADQRAAATAAAGLLTTEFGRDAATMPAAFDPTMYLVSNGSQDGSGAPATDEGPDGRYGLALLPYGSRDLELNALAALGAPDVVGRSILAAYLGGIEAADDVRREQKIVALAGLAALGTPVLTDLHAAASQPALTDLERIWLAVGLAESGDLGAARAMARDLLERSGQRSGGWARLASVSIHASVSATALLAIAAAQTGDPLAPDLAAYVAGQWDPEAVHPLEQVAYVERALTRLPRATARVAYTVDGERREADLEPGRGVALAFTPTQLASATLDAVSGAAVAACGWEAPATAADLPADPAVAVTRSTSVAGPFTAGSFTTVDLHVTLGATAPTGLYRVVETIPSGLAPTGATLGPPTIDDYGMAVREEDVIRPWSIDGNRVEWGFWWSGKASKPIVLRAVVRTVAPGTYTWEPAVVQSVTAPSVGSTVPATRVEILAP